MSFERERVQASVAALAAEGVFIGTSSWKYPGWFGQLYERDRYIWRGRFSEARFERNCLSEYAQLFKTVSVDAAFYQFPKSGWIAAMTDQVPDDFRLALKVTDEITVKQFPHVARFGHRAGKPNSNFLNADLFVSDFLTPCAPFKQKIGLLMFEFTQFHSEEFARGRDFVAALDQFFSRLPKDWNYGVEIRNRKFLHPDYFGVLAKHGATHVFNSWTDMPSVAEQMAKSESITNEDLLAARFLLKPGRRFEDAVKRFSPYQKLQEEYAEGREAARALIRRTREGKGRTRGFIFVNNRFEGNALDSIAAIITERSASL